MKIYKKILIVRTDRLGDVILSTPVIENIRAAYPEAHIAFMCRPYTKEVVVGNPFLDEVIVYDKYGRHKSFWNTLRFAIGLRKKKFDCVFILHPTNRAHVIAFLSGIPTRVGWKKKMGFLLTNGLTHYKNTGKKHEVEYTLDLLRAVEIPIVSQNTHFPISLEAKVKVETMLSDFCVRQGETLVVIHPSASCISKRWPLPHFSTLIRRIQHNAACHIVVISDESQKDLSDSLVRDNNIIDFRGKLSIVETAALIDRADLFISNDSGPVHIAASLRRPVIAIFGRNDPGLSPVRWRPLGNDSYYFHEKTDCRVCYAHNCKSGFKCLDAVDPLRVADAALEVMRRFKKCRR